MYIDRYGFTEPPFRMTPDARLYYASTVHARAHAHLQYGLLQQEGFIAVTGEVGAGKTTLIERLCGELDPAGFAVARVSTTLVSADDLLRLVADGFGVRSEGDKAAVLRDLIARLRATDRRHLLIVDEAQALPHPALEELRMLSNFTEGNRALLQIVLIGQPQLREVIASPDLDQLRQRILASYHLSGLSAEETRAYVEHRMRAVGWQGTPSWEPGALEAVHRHSGGIPRRINRLCSRVLLSASLENADQITASTVEATALELEQDLGTTLDRPRGAIRGIGYHPPPSVGEERVGTQLEDIFQRIDALERGFARRERVFQQLMDLFARGSR